MLRQDIFDSVNKAREAADIKWGPDSLHLSNDLYHSVTVLTEEVGEVARAALEFDHENLKAELIDVMQVATAILDSL